MWLCSNGGPSWEQRMAHVRIRTCPSGKTFCIVRWLVHLSVPILAVDGVCKSPMYEPCHLFDRSQEGSVVALQRKQGIVFVPFEVCVLRDCCSWSMAWCGAPKTAPQILMKTPHEAGIRSREQGAFVLNLTLFLPITLFLGNKIRSLWSTSLFSLFMLMLARLTGPLERWVKRN